MLPYLRHSSALFILLRMPFIKGNPIAGLDAGRRHLALMAAGSQVTNGGHRKTRISTSVPSAR